MPVMGIGFAMPGPYDYEYGISQFTGQNGKYENTFGLNVPEKIRDYMGLDEGFKVRFINDASAFAIGEDRAGATRGYSRSLAITLGTGFGSAFIKDALPVVEGAEVPETGCLWHLPFEGAIADDYFSTRGLCGRYKSLTGDHVAGVKEIADLATGDNPHAKSVFTDFGAKLGLFLSPWLRKFGVEAMVIGGNISNAYPLFETGLLTYLSNEQIDLAVFISELKESASFIGSATLIDDAFYGKVLPSIRKM